MAVERPNTSNTKLAGDNTGPDGDQWNRTWVGWPPSSRPGFGDLDGSGRQHSSPDQRLLQRSARRRQALDTSVGSDDQRQQPPATDRSEHQGWRTKPAGVTGEVDAGNDQPGVLAQPPEQQAEHRGAASISSGW